MILDVTKLPGYDRTKRNNGGTICGSAQVLDRKVNYYNPPWSGWLTGVVLQTSSLDAYSIVQALDKRWYLVPAHTRRGYIGLSPSATQYDDAHGPFETVEAALTTMRLMS